VEETEGRREGVKEVEGGGEGAKRSREGGNLWREEVSDLGGKSREKSGRTCSSKN
jgi:hypothetical protein